MPTTNLAPVLRQRFFDNNGNPLAGGKLYTYLAGTTTPQVTYTDSTGSAPNANPVIMDANGYAAVWLDPSFSYKFTLADSSDSVILTTDNVVGQLTASSVTTASLQDLSVSTAKIQDDAVDSTKLKDSVSVDGDRAVTTNHIRDVNVTRAKLAVGANARLAVEVKTAIFTATNLIDMYLCSAAGGAYAATLPDAATNGGLVLRFKKTDSGSNAITVTRAGSDTIDGATTFAVSIQYEVLELVSDGVSAWCII